MTRKTAAPLTPDLLARKGQATAAAWRDGHAASGPNVVTLTARSGDPSSERQNPEPTPAAAPVARAATGVARWHWPALALILVLGVAGGMMAFVIFSAPTADPPALQVADGVTPGAATAKPGDAAPPAAAIPVPPAAKAPSPPVARVPPVPVAKAPSVPVAKAPPVPVAKAPPVPVAKAPPVPAAKAPPAQVAKAPPVPAAKAPASPANAGALRLAAGPATPADGREAAPTAKAAELSSLPTAKAIPDTAAAPPAVAKTPPPVAARTAKPAAPKPVAAKRPFTVQFASLKSHAAANREWTRLKTRFGALLAGFEPTVQRAAVAKRGVFFRLRAGEFKTSGAARTFCKALQAKRQSCLVIRR